MRGGKRPIMVFDRLKTRSTPFSSCHPQYADFTSSMGWGQGTCYAAPHQHTLKWINPQVVTRAMLPINQPVTFTVNASTRGGPINGRPGRIALLVKPWVAGALWHRVARMSVCELTVVGCLCFAMRVCVVLIVNMAWLHVEKLYKQCPLIAQGFERLCALHRPASAVLQPAAERRA